MNNEEENNGRNAEDEITKVIEDLKSLPEVQLPSDFDRILKNKITDKNQKTKKSLFPYFPYSKVLVFGGSFVVVLCLVIFSVIFFKGLNEPIIKNVSIDSTYYENKKVVIIPPTENMTEGSSNKTIEKITDKKVKRVNDKQLREYFGEEKDSTPFPTGRIAVPLSTPKTMMDRCIKIDSIRKNDSLKKADE
jgi:hypothetical protein